MVVMLDGNLELSIECFLFANACKSMRMFKMKQATTEYVPQGPQVNHLALTS